MDHFGPVHFPTVPRPFPRTILLLSLIVSQLDCLDKPKLGNEPMWLGIACCGVASVGNTPSPTAPCENRWAPIVLSRRLDTLVTLGLCSVLVLLFAIGSCH